MDSPYSPLEFRLLNDYQRDFPLVAEPFRRIADALGSDEATVLATLAKLARRGAVSRVGAVLAPRRIGASTLAALAAPADRLEEIAALVSAVPEVNHNYQREHPINLWFVVTAGGEAELAAILAGIEARTGCAVISLPLVEEYHIDLGFDLAGSGRRCILARAAESAASSNSAAPAASANSGAAPASPNSAESPTRPKPAAPPASPDAAGRRLLAALQGGLELLPRPYARLAAAAGLSEAATLARLKDLQGDGTIKRFGVVVRHHELGFNANAMVVFDVPDDRVAECGRRLATQPGVTLCYRRRRAAPQWPYNLYCMVHGRARGEVEATIARLQGLAAWPAAALFSTRRFKQQGARYFAAAPIASHV